jgi:hypothetical protein
MVDDILEMNFPQKLAILGLGLGFIRCLQGYWERSFGLMIVLILVYFREEYEFYPMRSLVTKLD